MAQKEKQFPKIWVFWPYLKSDFFSKLTLKSFQKLDLRGVFGLGKEDFSYFDMFDLENWYNNLSDDAFSKYESTKEEVKAVLVGTGEKGDTCFGKVAGFYKDLFGSTLDQVKFLLLFDHKYF